MRYEILNRFKEDFENGSFQKRILSNYQLDCSRNFYYKVNKEGEVIEVTPNSAIEEVDWIRERDVFSSYFTYNKRLSSSNVSIMSNNYLTLIVKVGRLREEKLSIDGYYNDILNVYSDNELFNIKPFDLEHFNTVKSTLSNAYSQILEIFSEEFIQSKKEELSAQDFGKLLESKVRIFYDEDILTYKREINKYILTKCFLKKQYCVKKDNIIFGIPYVNQNANDSKPFLFNRTLPQQSGFMIPLKEAIWLHYINIYMDATNYRTYISTSVIGEKDVLGTTSQEGKTNILIKTTPTTTGSIISNYKIEERKEDTFTVYNVLKIKKKDEENKEVLYEEPSYDMSFKELYYYFSDLYGNNEKVMKDFNFRLAKSLLLGRQEQFKPVYRKFIDRTLDYLYLNTKGLSYKVSKLLNVRYSLDCYFKEEINLNIEELRNNVYSKVVNGIELENDEEFLFLYGQVYRYVINQSEAKDITFDFCQLPLRIRNEKTLKKELQNKVYKYSHALNLKDKRITNALALVYEYSLKEQLNFNNNTKIHTGLYYENLFYIKNNTTTKNSEE